MLEGLRVLLKVMITEVIVFSGQRQTLQINGKTYGKIT